MENVLSKVATVTVRPELLNSPLLKGRRKAELRLEVIKDYIRRKPYGKRIKMQEIKDVGHFNSVASADMYMKRMIAKGDIVRHEISPRRFFYAVPGEVKVTKPATNKAPVAEAAPTPEDVSHEEDGRYRGSRKPRGGALPLSTIEQQAMRYLYHYGAEADNVRSFVTWLNSQEDNSNE